MCSERGAVCAAWSPAWRRYPGGTLGHGTGVAPWGGLVEGGAGPRPKAKRVGVSSVDRVRVVSVVRCIWPVVSAARRH